MRKSTNAITAAIGTIKRGKYTLLMRLALPMRLFEASTTAVAKKLHGAGRQRPSEHMAQFHLKAVRIPMIVTTTAPKAAAAMVASAWLSFDS
jgi:hypothetical protein